MAEHAPSLYRNASPATRVHTRLRWWSCPFPVIERAVPPGGDILEVGCGHGLLSCELALRAPARQVFGVDIDTDKIDAARRAAQQGGLEERVSFAAVRAGFVPDRPFDAVVVCDVLYLLPSEQQKALLLAAARCVRPGGVVVVKEMGLEPRWKYRWNHLQETFATRVLPITASDGEGMAFTPPEEMAAWLEAGGLSATVQRCDRRYPWPHVLIVGHARHED